MTKVDITTQDKNIDTLFIASTQSDLDTLLPEIETKVDLNESYSVVAFNSLIQMRLAKNGIQYITPDEHIKESSLITESRKMFERISSFLTKNHTNVYCIKDQNLFEILRFEMERKLKDIFVYSKVIEHVFQQNKPKSFMIVSDNSTQSVVTECFLSRKNVNLIRIRGSFKSQLESEASDLISKSKTWIKYNIGYVDKSLEEGVKSDTSSKKKVLFLVYGKPHLNQLLPVAIEINKRSRLNAKAIIVNNMNVIDALVGNKMDFGVFRTYLTEHSAAEIKNRIQSIKNNWRKLEQNEKFRQLFNWDGQDLWDVVRRPLREIFLYHFPVWIRTYYTARDMIKAENPDLIFFAYDIRPHEKSIILAAKGNSTPTLVIQHGVTAGHIGFVPLTADKMAVFGEYSKTFLVNHGVEGNKLIITGRPMYDSWARRIGVKDSEKICRNLGIHSDKKVILMATGALLYHHVDTFENIRLLYMTVINTINKFEDCKLIIKIHPAEDIDNYKLISGSPKDVNFIKDIKLTELLTISDVVITDLSTVGLEAMLLDIPVITINFTGKPDAMPYASSNAAIGVYDPEKLKEAIKGVLHNENTRNILHQNAKMFLKDYLYKLDGNSAKRVSALIEEMVYENTKIH